MNDCRKSWHASGPGRYRIEPHRGRAAVAPPLRVPLNSPAVVQGWEAMPTAICLNTSPSLVRELIILGAATCWSRAREFDAHALHGAGAVRAGRRAKRRSVRTQADVLFDHAGDPHTEARQPFGKRCARATTTRNWSSWRRRWRPTTWCVALPGWCCARALDRAAAGDDEAGVAGRAFRRGGQADMAQRLTEGLDGVRLRAFAAVEEDDTYVYVDNTLPRSRKCRRDQPKKTWGGRRGSAAPTLDLAGASAGLEAPWHYVVETDVPPEAEADLKARRPTRAPAGLASVPGTKGARYECRDQGPRHLACYDLEISTFVAWPARHRLEQPGAAVVSATRAATVFQKILEPARTGRTMNKTMGEGGLVGRVERWGPAPCRWPRQRQRPRWPPTRSSGQCCRTRARIEVPVQGQGPPPVLLPQWPRPGDRSCWCACSGRLPCCARAARHRRQQRADEGHYAA